jgi:hypothetical protein
VKQVRCGKCGRLYEEGRTDCSSCGAPYAEEPDRDAAQWPGDRFCVTGMGYLGVSGTWAEMQILYPDSGCVTYGGQYHRFASPNPPDPEPDPSLFVPLCEGERQSQTSVGLGEAMFIVVKATLLLGGAITLAYILLMRLSGG